MIRRISLYRLEWLWLLVRNMNNHYLGYWLHDLNCGRSLEYRNRYDVNFTVTPHSPYLTYKWRCAGEVHTQQVRVYSSVRFLDAVLLGLLLLFSKAGAA
jgi:arginyl-tRNA--protein-N-Asp/Glu arginylyltransferase